MRGGVYLIMEILVNPLDEANMLCQESENDDDGSCDVGCEDGEIKAELFA